MSTVEILVGIAEIAVALAGFTGVVVAFGSRGQGAWHPGDKLRLGFLLESSLTAAGFSLLALLLLSLAESEALTWAAMSGIWALFMPGSLWSSRKRIAQNADAHGDVDKVANRITGALFWVLVAVQIANVLVWREFAPFLAALLSNMAGSAMQFSRLIRSAFHDG